MGTGGSSISIYLAAILACYALLGLTVFLAPLLAPFLLILQILIILAVVLFSLALILKALKRLLACIKR